MMEEDFRGAAVVGSGVDVEKFLKDSLNCCSIQSPVPEISRLQECCMGIDEAGRGPVLGG